MKKILTLLALLLSLSLFAQNDKADHIMGTYLSSFGKDTYKVSVVKLPDNSYQATICWLAAPYGPDGKMRTDTKNPDKKKRNTPLGQVVLFSGLQYNADKQNWSGTKIYDPTRGIHAKMTARFDNPETLIVQGTLFGITENHIWKKQD